MSFLDRAKEVLGAAPAEEIAEEVVEQNSSNNEPETPVKETEEESIEEATKEPDAKEEPKKAPVEEIPEEEPTDDECLSKEEADDISARIIEEALTSEDRAEKPENSTPIQPKEARNEMRDLKFYDKLGEKAFNFDRGLEMAPELRDWITGAIEDDRVLSVDFVSKVLPRVLEKNPDLVEDAIREAKKADDHKFVPFKVLFINSKDTEDTTEYATFKEACVTIQKEIDTYGVDPMEVFKAFYRRIDAEGNLGDRVSIEEVEKYVEKFNGDKLALRKKLHLPKRDKKPEQGSQPQNQPKNQSKKGNKKPKKADNGGV